MIDAERAVAHLSGLEQQHLARDLVNMVTADRRVQSAIVGSLNTLTSWSADCEARLVAMRQSSLLMIVWPSSISSTMSRKMQASMHSARLALVYYASCALAAEAHGGLDSVKRFLDLLGAADDDGEEGMFADSVRYVLDPSPVLGAALVLRVNEHAASL